MTTILGSRPSWLGGARSREDAERPWRNVPTISLISSWRGTAITRLALLLILVVLVEAFALQYQYRANLSAQDSADKVLTEVEGVQSLIGEQDSAMAAEQESLEQTTARIQSEMGGRRSAWRRATSSRARSTSWASKRTGPRQSSYS